MANPAATTILCVDDEEDLLDILRFNLESEGFLVLTATSAEEALSMMGQHPDLILLDVMMDRVSGFEMAHRLRSQGNNVPIIFLTALSDEPHQVQGFDVGGDDFVTKPYSFPTLLARIRAVLKRSAASAVAEGAQPPDATEQVLTVGSLLVNLAHKTVVSAGQPVSLTRKEYNILLLLLQKPGLYFTREDIMHRVWDSDIVVGDRSVDVHIARLRKKLGPNANYISNRIGFGYCFDPQGGAAPSPSKPSLP